jgi:hypothetical protein
VRTAPQGIVERDELSANPEPIRRNSRIVPLTLSISFLVSCGIGCYQNVVIREQMATQRNAQAAHERDVKRLVKAYWSASARAKEAEVDLSVCKFKEV